MKKKLIIITTVVIMLLSVVSSLPVSAYVAPNSLYTYFTSSYYDFTAPSNGVLLIHTFYNCNISPSAPGLSLIDMLDNSFLQSPNNTTFTWQGVEHDSQINLKDVSDVVGFSQTYAYSSTKSSFVYSIITCIPVVDGDKFEFYFMPNSDFVSTKSPFGCSFIPYGTGCSKVYEAFSNTSSDCSYTTKSDNQHLALILNPSLNSNNFNYYSSMVSTSSNNLSFVRSNYSSDVYTTTYGLSKSSEITVTPNDNVVDWSFSVYEIFTDGTSTPGIGDSGGGGSGGSGSGGTVGDITVNVDMSETNGKLDTLIATVKALPSEIWDCFKVGLGITSDSGSSGGSSSGGTSGGSSSFIPPSDLDVEIDSENVSNTLKGTIDSFLDSFASMKGAFHFFWKFVDNFFTSVSLYGVVGLSLIFALAYWLLNR